MNYFATRETASESPLPSHKAPASCGYIPLLSIVLGSSLRSGGLLDLGVDPAWLTYF